MLPALTFDSFVPATWFKLPLLPSAVRISLVYPLQLLLYISMKNLGFPIPYGSVFQSCCSCSYYTLLGSSLLLGDCTSDGLLCARLKTSNRVCPAALFIYTPNLWVSYSSENMDSASIYAAFWESNQLVRFMRTLPGPTVERRKTKGRGNSVKWDLNPCDCCCMGLQANGLKAPWRSVVYLSAPALCRPNPIWLFLGFACLL